MLSLSSFTITTAGRKCISRRYWKLRLGYRLSTASFSILGTVALEHRLFSRPPQQPACNWSAIHLFALLSLWLWSSSKWYLILMYTRIQWLRYVVRPWEVIIWSYNAASSTLDNCLWQTMGSGRPLWRLLMQYRLDRMILDRDACIFIWAFWVHFSRGLVLMFSMRR